MSRGDFTVIRRHFRKLQGSCLFADGFDGYERNTPSFTASDEERLMQLHALLSKYGETDDLPSPLLSSETNKKLDSLINRLTQLVEKKEE